MGQRAGESDKGTGRAVDAAAIKPAGKSTEQSDQAIAVGARPLVKDSEHARANSR
jgi:hypothetical protein